MIAYFINPADRSVTQIELRNWDAMRLILEGSAEVALTYTTGDTVFVDEEGFLKPQTRYFRMADIPDRPFAGVGIMLGAETKRGFKRPQMSLETLRSRVIFCSRAVVVELLRGRPSMMFTPMDGDKPGKPEVLETWDHLLEASKPMGSKV